jgi:predicted TPR repeat methyltransferase
MKSLPPELLQAIEHHQAGQTDKAKEIYLRILDREPEQADALRCLGALALDEGDVPGAIQLVRRAIAAEPGDAMNHTNLGGALLAAGDIQGALSACLRSLELDPDFADGRFNLAVVYEDRGNLAEAELCYTAALAIDPDCARALNNLGRLLRKRGLSERAIECYRSAATLQPTVAEYHKNLGKALQAEGRLSEAAAAYQNAVALDPSDASTDHVLAALTGRQNPSAPPARYIERLFDDYAHRFDHHLVELLGYRIPEILDETVRALRPAGGLDILDLGCGTGLCGSLFRDQANRLVGVDLSEKMLEKAEARGVYDRLDKDEMLASMARSARSYDLILAADVLVYVGDLTPILLAATATLRPLGLFVFTIESHSDVHDFRLNPTVRYTHSPNYVERAAIAAGLSILVSRPVSGRIQDAIPVAGHLFALELGPSRPAPKQAV